MGRSLLAGWQNLLSPPEAFNIGEFVGNHQQDVVPHSAQTMFRLLYQPTARDPDRPFLFTPISIHCSGWSYVGPTFSETSLPKRNCVTSEAGGNAMKCKFWTPPCKLPSPAGPQVISAGPAAEITAVLSLLPGQNHVALCSGWIWLHPFHR